MLSIGVALVMKCVVSYSQRRLRKACISRLYSSKRRFTRPPLLTRQNALVLKVGLSCKWKMTKCVASYSQRRLRKAYISRLYSSKRRFTRPPLLTRRNALVLKVGVSCKWKMTKCVASYSQRRLRKACISRLYSSKTFYPPSITNKTERFSFKSGCVIRVENEEMRNQL